MAANRFKYLFYLGLWVVCLATGFRASVSGAVIINEVMANEPGSETSLEWVELHNIGGADRDLTKYIFIEGGDTTRFAGSVIIPAGGFVVLARKATASVGVVSFETKWGNGSGIWGDDPGESYLLVAAKMSLRNTCDTVKLVETESGASETAIWASSQPDGVSYERINPNKPATENFGICKAVSGSTPGAVNSLLPPEHDLGIVTSSSGVTVPTDTTQLIVLTIGVYNHGLAISEPGYVRVYFDRDFSGTLTEGDGLDSISMPELAPDSIVTLSHEFAEAPGRKRMVIELPADADSTDNSLILNFAFGRLFRELVVNEFVPNPTDQLDCEWMELKNVAEYSVSLKGFAVGDVTRRYAIDSEVIIAPGERAIVCEDTNSFLNFFGAVECRMVQPEGWQRLDNAGDVVVVENDLGALSDSVQFVGSPQPGFSWERDEDSLSGSFVTVFYQCTDSLGATPCRENSMRDLPPENDLGITQAEVQVVAYDNLTPVSFEIVIRNFGYLPSLLSLLSIYDDRDFDSLAEDEGLLYARRIEPLAAGDSLVVQCEEAFEAGQHAAIIVLQRDENNANDTVYAKFSVGPLTGEVIITEFLANPEGALETEWIEAKNVSGRSINLQNWTVGDSVHQYAFGEDVEVMPGQYFVAAQDSAAFRRYYVGDCTVLQPATWATLNNTGDAIVFKDDNGVISDSLIYATTGDGNRSLELNERDISAGRKWYVSTAGTCATPCAANSVSSDIVEGIDVRLTNRVFSPRLSERLTIRVSCPPATAFTIEVFDLAGRKHCTIAGSQPMSSGVCEYDGRSEHYGTLPPGAYILKVESRDGIYSKKFGFAVADEK